MKFKIQSQLTYQVVFPSTFIFNIQALNTSSQTILEEKLTVSPELEIQEFTSNSNSCRFVRLKAEENSSFTISYDASVNVSYKSIESKKVWGEVPLENLNGDIIPYLFPSRYCQSDKLQKLAYKEFGEMESTYKTVLAITDWIYNNVEYIQGSTGSQTSAFDTITERAGVCRDFAHLGIALCRSLSIPARYFTCYAYKLNPQDFHACFEAYIDGHWIIFDPTRLVPLNGLVKIASGRDASVASFATIFGNAYISDMQINCNLDEPDFSPYWYEKNSLTGLSFQ